MLFSAKVAIKKHIENNMKGLHMVAFILLVIGGLLWGIWGLSGWEIGSVLGESVAKIVYVLVGLSAILEVLTHKKNCKGCDGGSGGGSSM